MSLKDTCEYRLSEVTQGAEPNETGSPGERLETPAFRVVSNRSALVPGIDPTRLKQINDQLQTEDFIESANK